MTDTVDLVVSLFMAGMALAFVVADPRSPSSRALALALGLGALSFSLNILGQSHFFRGNVALGSRAFGISEAAALVATFEWLLRVRRTAGASSRGGNLLRIAQGLVLRKQQSRDFEPVHLEGHALKASKAPSDVPQKTVGKAVQVV